MARVAVIQAGSVYGNLEATERLERPAREAAAEGAELAVFPEAFRRLPQGIKMPGSPVGRRSEAGRDEYLRYASTAVSLDGPELAQISELAHELGLFLVIGVIELTVGRCTAPR